MSQSGTNQLDVLVVDDEPFVVRLVRNGLADAGLAVRHAHTASDALAVLERSPAAALVVGCRLSDMSVQAFVEAVQAMSACSMIPKVFIADGPVDEQSSWTRAINELKIVEQPVSVRGIVAHLQTALAAA